MNIPENYCILDIETWTPTGEPDPTKDELRYVGFKSCSGNYRIYKAANIGAIQQALNTFGYYIGHNIENYDIPILNRYGLNCGGIVIDTYKIVERRVKSMMYIDLNQGDKSLKRLLEIFNLNHRKLTFDYSLLKEQLTPLQEKELVDYLKTDLDGAEELFKYFYEIFIGLKSMMNYRDQKRMCWLVNSPGSTVYKCICNLTGMKEEYNDVEDSKDVLYSGAFVSEPYNDFFEG